MPGYRAWKLASRSDRIGSAQPLTMPTATWPRTSPVSSSIATRAPPAASSAARANGSTAAPASVRADRPARPVQQRLPELAFQPPDLAR